MNTTVAVIFVIVFVIGVVTGIVTVVAMAAVRRDRAGELPDQDDMLERDHPRWPGPQNPPG